MGADILGVLLTVLLLAANAFFVGSEFALISARRDRLEALAEQGKKRAVAVIRAGEQLSQMLAGAQLGITICSILLGRVAEPAVAHLLEKPFALIGVSGPVLHTVAFVIALAIVVTLHVLLGEMVPKNIAIAGPESTAMLLIPAYLLYVRAARPLISFYNWAANGILRLFGVTPKDELDVTVSTVELAEMITESRSEGLLDPEEHMRLSRALQIRNRTVEDVAMPLAEMRSVPAARAGMGPRLTDIQQALAQTGYSRFPVVGPAGDYLGFVHIKDILDLVDDPTAAVDGTLVRPLPRLPAGMPLAEALSELRRRNSHLALVDAPDGSVGAMVTLEDLVEDLVGTVRDGMHRQ
ncbi:MAG: HlyC/CorC family transporter [Mycobacterium sp.]|nr:HlyC/CorC family transporter [Mycobacterium sp.]